MLREKSANAEELKRNWNSDKTAGRLRLYGTPALMSD